MVLLSFLIVIVAGFIMGHLFNLIKLPKLIGMIFVGILIGPSVLNIISPNFMKLAPYLRQVALVIIITRSGLSINLLNLKKLGKTAILLAILPATLEIIGILIFAPIILNISILESLLLGTTLAAVSPAIIIPRMIKYKEDNYGTNKSLPDLIMTGSSVDDIYVIILFYTFLGLLKGNSLSAITILVLPLNIILSILVGLIFSYLLKLIMDRFKLNNISSTIVVSFLSFGLILLEKANKSTLNFSSLLSILTICIFLAFKYNNKAITIENNYKKLWVIFEIILFVLVGLSINLNYIVDIGFAPIIIILIGLVFRSIGVYLSLLFSDLNVKEKVFTIFSYFPKATVQASIGAIALNEGLSVGPLIFTIAALSILITAPIGAILMDNTYKKFLTLDLVN